MSASSKFLSFDALYAIICESLRSSGKSDEVLSNLKCAVSDYDRIKLILEEEKLKILKLFQDNIRDHYEVKRDVKANELRDKWRLKKSLPLLNKALLFCPNFSCSYKPISNTKEFIEFDLLSSNDSSDTSMKVKPSDIFHERSRKLYEDGAYEKCIQDIFMSVQSKGEKTFEKAFILGQCYMKLFQLSEAKTAYEYTLNLLRQSNLDNECKSKETIKVVKEIKKLSILESQVSKQTDPLTRISDNVVVSKGDYIQLFDGSNKTIAGTSSAVTLKFLEGRGRHMIATKLIPPGSTLIIERPYTWSVTPSKYECLCQFCVQPTVNPIPCENCSSVIFCSLECYWKAHEFHRLECKILKLLDSSEKLGKMGLLCFRTIAKTPIEEVKEEFSKWTSPDPSKTTMLGLGDQGVLDSSKYSAVYAQTPNSSERNAGDLFKRTCAAVYLTLCLRYTGYFKTPIKAALPENDQLTSDEMIVASALLRHLQSVSCNAYGINLISKGTKDLEIEEIGGATNPVISTTNHSCYPNVYRINSGNTCVVKALREISEGEEILDSYGPQFTTMKLEERLEELERQYLFLCSCTACVENWGSFQELKKIKTSWKCSFGCPRGVLEDKTGNKRKCIKCGETTDVKKLQKMLKTSEEKYLQAKELVIRESCDSKEIEKVLKYISTAQKLLHSPCIEVVEAQEILKLYWNLQIKNSG